MLLLEWQVTEWCKKEKNEKLHWIYDWLWIIYLGIDSNYIDDARARIEDLVIHYLKAFASFFRS